MPPGSEMSSMCDPLLIPSAPAPRFFFDPYMSKDKYGLGEILIS